MDQRKAKCGRYGMFTGILNVGILGLVLGAALAVPFKPETWTCSDVASVLATGIALAYVLLGAGDWIVQRLALAKNPLPIDLDLSDRAIARERVSALPGGSLLARHARRLLDAWSAGASGPQVAVMAANQTGRLLALLVAEAGFILVLLVAAQGFAAPGPLLTLVSGLMVLVALVALARFQLASQTAGYIESHLLARIGNDTPAAAAADFAMAASKAASESMAALAAAQAKFVEQLAKSQDQASALAAKAQAEAAAQIAKAQTDAAAQIAKTQAEAAAQVAKAQQDAAAQLAKAQDDMTVKLTAALDQSSAKIGASQTEVATQLGRVTALASSIDNVLKLQQAVDGTLKGVTVTDEFKSTLVELKRHLAESDQLLKNAAKPRTIRLVEKDNE
jgi:hypothetical protein